MFHHAITVVNSSRSNRYQFDVLKDFPFPWDEGEGGIKEAIKETRIERDYAILKQRA